MKINRVALFSLPLMFSLVILGICYPGFMSYDSIRMLEEARSSVRGGIYPAAPVYLLRLFDVTGHGVTLMLQMQNFIILLSVMLILRQLGASLRASAITLLALVAMPTVIGCMLVLWKDVTVASLVMLSVAMIFRASQSQARKEVSFYHAVKWISLLLLLLGTLVRFNAITATAIIALYWLVVFYKDQSWKIRGAAFIAILVCMVASNKVINNYTFPDFRKLEPNNLVYAVMTYDLIGISGWSRVSLIPIEAADSEPLPKASISDIDKIYSSLGALAMNDGNVALGNVVKPYPMKYRNEDITKAWLGAIYNHPMAYLRYRWDLFSEIIGVKFHATFEPTHFGRIDQNPFGIQFQDRLITNITLKYIQATSNIFLGKPWFIFLLSFSTTLLVYKSRLIHPEAKKLTYYSFAAALLYVSPFFIVSGTGEVRYSFPAIVLGCIPVFVWIFGHYLPQRDANREAERKVG